MTDNPAFGRIETSLVEMRQEWREIRSELQDIRERVIFIEARDIGAAVVRNTESISEMRADFAKIVAEIRNDIDALEAAEHRRKGVGSTLDWLAKNGVNVAVIFFVVIIGVAALKGSV